MSEKPAPASAQSTSESSRKEIYRYKANFPIYSVDWSWRKEFPYRLAFTSFIEGLNNRITLIQLDEESRTLKPFATVEHPFPPTKVMWMPYQNSDKPDLFATTGDFLRIWEWKKGSVISKSVLNSVCSSFLSRIDMFTASFFLPLIFGPHSANSRKYCKRTAHFIWLEYIWSKPNRHVQHRYYLYSLGYQ